MVMKVCILAGGQASRWGGGDKTRTIVEGRPLLERTILQAIPISPYLEVIGENKYCNLNQSLVHKLFVSQLYRDDYLVLFGDTYYTDQAIETIRLSIKTAKKPLFFGRKDASKYTGKKYGELFAFYCPYKYRFSVLTKALMLTKMETNKKNFWELYRELHKIPINIHEVKDDFVEINDRTEDFDFKEDLERWMQYSTV